MSCCGAIVSSVSVVALECGRRAVRSVFERLQKRRLSWQRRPLACGTQTRTGPTLMIFTLILNPPFTVDNWRWKNIGRPKPVGHSFRSPELAGHPVIHHRQQPC